MKKQIVASLIGICSLGFVFPQMNSEAQQPQAQHSSGARINIEQAKSAALEQVDGKIVNIGLENDDRALVYDVNVQKSGRIYEVTVDAGSGNILNIKKQLKEKGR